MSKVHPSFEQGILAELIYQTSDISQLAKWPLRLFALICALGSAVIWYAKYDWHYFLNNKDMDFLDSFSRFTETLSVVLKVGLFISFIVVLISLVVFIFSFFKKNTSKVISEAIEVLVSNSFFFGISLVFILSTVSNLRQATSQIMYTATQKIDCANNLNKIGKELLIYAIQNHHHYPSPDKWCDVLIKNTEVSETDFLCPGAAEGNCHYALNPDAEPISRYNDFDSFLDNLGTDKKELWPHSDTKENKKRYEFLLRYYFIHSSSGKKEELSNIVLVFETTGGWNKFGGPELLTTENHKGEGANILFNDGTVKFVEPDKFNKLEWKFRKNNID